ncbi:MAG: cytochrome c maturation protein CcmE [Caldisericia bacterium]
MKKTRIIIGAVIVVLLVTISIWMFVVSSTPYTQDFDEAMSGSRVQVWGNIDEDSILGNKFSIVSEDGKTMPVMLLEQMPSNIEHADSCVVTGMWKDSIFEAESILLKCPSKYEEKVEEK